jgi:hypothetical protein
MCNVSSHRHWDTDLNKPLPAGEYRVTLPLHLNAAKSLLEPSAKVVLP